MYLLKHIIEILEEIAPVKLKESWDNVGLLLGSYQHNVQNVLCALDINDEVIDEAINSGAQCIITHHPFIFKPLYKIDLDTSQGRWIKKLIMHNIAVYTMHTNYDIAKGGINDIICDALNIKNTKVLHNAYQDEVCKVAVYVPDTHYECIRQVIVEQDLGQIGDYKGCTFTVQGEGTFVPLQGSNPYLGTQNQLEKVQERKIEFIAYASQIKQIQEIIKKHHPYEEVAFDIYTLNHTPKIYGIGRYGELEEEIDIEEFIAELKKVFNVFNLRTTTILCDKVKRVAVCSGSGASFIKTASKVADFYITADVKFHEAQQAQTLGLTVVDVGHYASENIAMSYLASYLKNKFADLHVMSSTVNAEVFHIK